jgi:N-acetyl-gamma-glutamyl-phosphate reductase
MHKYSQARPRAGVLGVSGYSGRELLALLERHGGVETVALDRDGGAAEAVRQHRLNVLFLCTPHEASLEAAPAALQAGARVVDLSGAFRLKDPAAYQRWYKFTHHAPELLAEAVYGLPEWNRAAVPAARLVANPGCYPTSVILGLKPLLCEGLVDVEAGLVCDSKSGVSGAGHKPSPATHFCAVQENFRAYGILEHRHVPEMVQALEVPLEHFCFTAHLLPVVRGILSTLYVKLTRACSRDELLEVYLRRYPQGGFVRFTAHAPDLHGVQRTNYCDLHITMESSGRRAVIVSAIDNLVKGAAGAAVQCFNLMSGFPEEEGLRAMPLFP